MEKFEIIVGTIWLLSILFIPATMIMVIWGVDSQLLLKMFLTDAVILVITSILMQFLHGN